MRKYSQVKAGGHVNATMLTERDEKQTSMSLADWLNELNAQAVNNGSKNPFAQNSTARTQTATAKTPTYCYEPPVSPQTVRKNNPFKSGMRNEMHDSGIGTPYYVQSTPANLKSQHAVRSEQTNKVMSLSTPVMHHRPCQHATHATPHIVHDPESNAVCTNEDEQCFLEMNRSRRHGKKPRQMFYDLSSDSGEECGAVKERIPTLRPGQFDGSTS